MRKEPKNKRNMKKTAEHLVATRRMAHNEMCKIDHSLFLHVLSNVWG